MKRVRLGRYASGYKKSGQAKQMEAWIADSYLSRLRGLLGKKQLSGTDGLLLKRCSAVHTIGMRYSLDLVFMDREGKVLKCAEGVKPFRMATAKGAYYTLELNEGVINEQDISISDHFYWEHI